jgi:hypothetical protein
LFSAVVVAFHSGEQTVGVPEQFVLPAASNAYKVPPFVPTKTRPFATTGSYADEPSDAVHSGAHVVGVPEQPLCPCASNAYRVPSWPATNTVVPSVAGSLCTGEPLAPSTFAVHSGLQVIGDPEQFVDPFASYAWSCPVSLWTYAVEPDTATDEGTNVDDDGWTFALQTGCSVDQSFELTELSNALNPVWAEFAATHSQSQPEHKSATAPTMTIKRRRGSRDIANPPVTLERTDPCTR